MAITFDEEIMKIMTNVNLNDNQSQSQSKRILAYMKNGGRITSLEALNKFGCLRLSARIYDLKKQGHNIKDETVKVSSGKRVTSY